MRQRSFALLLFVAFAFGCCTAEAVRPARPLSRAEFLKRFEKGLKNRSGRELAALTDWSRWKEDGNIDSAALELILPPAPLTRERELNEREILYRDGQGRQWRLVLEESGKPVRFTLPIRTRACPEGIQRAPMDSDVPDPRPKKASSWTPLECYPLPM